MPSISDLNGGVVKVTPSATDKIPVQEAGGNTVPITVAGLVAKVLSDPAFLTAVDARITADKLTTAFSEAVDDRVAALLIAGTGVTITYNDAANTLTVTAP